MRYIIFILVAMMVVISSCKKDDDIENPSSTDNTVSLQLHRQYVGYWNTEYTDSIMPTSYWKVNGTTFNLPTLGIITDTSINHAQIPGYELYETQRIKVKSGDVLTLHIDLKHPLIYFPGSVNGIYYIFHFAPQTSYEFDYMCRNSLMSQTITYTVQ